MHQFNLTGPDLGVIALISVIYLFLLPALLRWLWNMTIPRIFGIRAMTLLEALGVVFICGFLFIRFP